METYTNVLIACRGLTPIVVFGALGWLGDSFNWSITLVVASMIAMAWYIGVHSTAAEIAVEVVNMTVCFSAVWLYFQTIAYDAAPIGFVRVLIELTLYYLFQDTWFYWMHYDMHNGCWQFARKIHMWHHSVHTDCFLKAFYNHPIEPLLLAVPSLLCGHVVMRLFGYGSHVTMCMWLPIAIFDIMWTHSGVDISWLPDTRMHSLHHIRGRKNYALLWDRIMGTAVHPDEMDGHVRSGVDGVTVLVRAD